MLIISLGPSSHSRTNRPVLSTCPLYTISGCGKERHINWSMVTCQGSTRYWNYLEVYWPCAGGLSAMNAIGTQLRDPINSGLTRWRMAVEMNKRTPPRKSREKPVFSLSMGMRRLTRDGTVELVSRDQTSRRERGQGFPPPPVQLTTSMIVNLTPLVLLLLYVMVIHTHTCRSPR